MKGSGKLISMLIGPAVAALGFKVRAKPQIRSLYVYPLTFKHSANIFFRTFDRIDYYAYPAHSRGSRIQSKRKFLPLNPVRLKQKGTAA